jgi:hypothetical protein
MASLVIKDIFGDPITGNTFTFPTTEAGTSQFIRVSFDPQFASGESATLPLNIVGSEASLISTSPLVFNNSTQEHLIEIRGADDASKDGSVNFTLQLGPSTAGTPSSYDGTQLNLTIANSDDDGNSTNRAPTEPTLLAPASGTSFQAGSTGTRFEWQHAYDADKDSLFYHLCFSQSESMSNMRCVTVGESRIVPGSGVAGFGMLTDFVMGVFLLALLAKRLPFLSRLSSLSFCSLMLFVGLASAACGNQSLLDALHLPPRPKVAINIPALNPPLLSPGTWYWRVYADDQKGNVIASSQTRNVVVGP